MSDITTRVYSKTPCGGNQSRFVLPELHFSLPLILFLQFQKQKTTCLVHMHTFTQPPSIYLHMSPHVSFMSGSLPH